MFKTHSPSALAPSALAALALGAVVAALLVAPAVAQTAAQTRPRPQPQSSVRTYLNHLAEKLAQPPVKQNSPGAVTGVRG